MKKNKLRMNNVLGPLYAYLWIETAMPIEGDTTYQLWTTLQWFFKILMKSLRFIKIYLQKEKTLLINLNILSPNLKSMTYAIFIPFGKPGWQPMMECNDRLGTNLRQRNVTMLQHEISQTAIRDSFNPLLQGGKLLQECTVDSYLQVEVNNLNFMFILCFVYIACIYLLYFLLQ